MKVVKRLGVMARRLTFHAQLLCTTRFRRQRVTCFVTGKHPPYGQGANIVGGAIPRLSRGGNAGFGQKVAEKLSSLEKRHAMPPTYRQLFS